MSRNQIGLTCCLSFVTLEAFQAVYLGSIFQEVDSFFVGTWVFGISVVGCVAITAALRPTELRASARAWKLVIALNLLAASTWTTYFIAVQLIEPAVVFTIFSGMVPLGTLQARWMKVPEAWAPKRGLVQVGNALILVSILSLAAITVFGFSGFVRGGAAVAIAGVCLSALSGGCMAFAILYSIRLNGRGVGPLAQFGLRFVLYSILACLALALGIDEKGTEMMTIDTAMIVVVGLLVIAFPLYLVQKAIPLIDASTIAAMTALGPAMVFAMQLLDGRVAYSTATLLGLTVFVVGALLAVFGVTRPFVARGS